MMASLDAEAEMENLFAADEAEEDGATAATQSLTQEEAERTGGANLDLTSAAGDGKIKKRVIRNPQPKLNPERLMGPRGIQTIEDIFKDWESKGKGKEFDDLDMIMGKLEHWAHRLYPKLPFDNVIDVIANRLGSKKTVQTHMKKIRLGMVTAPVHVGGDAGVVSDNEDEVARYGGADDEPDVFQELLNKAGGGTADAPPIMTQAPVPPSGGLTEEQKERIRKNKELAAAKKREKLERERREAEELERRKAMDQQLDEEEDELEREMMSENKTVNMDSTEQGSTKDDDIDDTAPPEPTNSPREENNKETLDLDEMMEQMEED